MSEAQVLTHIHSSSYQFTPKGVRLFNGPTARHLPLPYSQIINPLESLVRAEDQASNKPADMFKPFRTTKDLSKAFHPFGKDLRHPNNWQHSSTLSFSISPLLSSSIRPFFPITFQVVYPTPSVGNSRNAGTRGTWTRWCSPSTASTITSGGQWIRKDIRPTSYSLSE